MNEKWNEEEWRDQLINELVRQRDALFLFALAAGAVILLLVSIVVEPYL